MAVHSSASFFRAVSSGVWPLSSHAQPAAYLYLFGKSSICAIKSAKDRTYSHVFYLCYREDPDKGSASAAVSFLLLVL